MLDASLIVLPEVEQALISAMQDIKKFCFDLQNDENTPKRLNKSLLYKAHHHIQLCESSVHGSGILLPHSYLAGILLCLEALQDNKEVEPEKFKYLLRAIQGLLEYINHSLSIGVQEKNQQKYICHLYYPYNKLLNEFGIEDILSIEDFTEKDEVCPNVHLMAPYYARYDIFLLKQLKEYIINIKDNWHDPELTLDYAHKSIDIILNIEWHELMPLMQCVVEYLENKQTNADLEVASGLLFLEYIINEPWRVHSIITKNAIYTLKQVISTLVEQIYSPNVETEIDINDVHQRVQAYSIRKSVLHQIDILVKESQSFISSDSNKSSEILQQVINILYTIGFKDKSNLLVKLQQKLASLQTNKVNEQDIHYINYIFSSLSQYIQNNYPEDMWDNNDDNDDIDNNGKDEDDFDSLFSDNFLNLNNDDSNNSNDIDNISSQNNLNDNLSTSLEIDTNLGDISDNDIENNVDDDNHQDNELWEIFKEEQQDLLTQLQKYRDEWKKDIENKDVVFSIRRCYHTFKGSFRMLELNHQAKSSSNIEQIFNKYISQKDVEVDILFQLIEISLIALAELRNVSNQHLEEINSICDIYLSKETVNLNLNTNTNNLTQINAETPASIHQDNKIIFKQNLLFIYIHEVEQILHSLEPPLQQRNAKEFLKIMHKIEGSSSTANCVCMQEWCKYIRKAISIYRSSNKISEVVATLVQYAVYIAYDIPKTLNIDNLHEGLTADNKAFLEQIVEKAEEDAKENGNLANETDEDRQRELEEQSNFDISLESDISHCTIDTKNDDRNDFRTSTNIANSSNSSTIPIKNYTNNVENVNNQANHANPSNDNLPQAKSTNVEGIIDNTGMSNLNTIDIELVSLFIEEAQTLHSTINQNIDSLYADNNSTKEILRALHTLKGGARMVGINNLGEQYHLLEDDVAQHVNINTIQQKLLDLSQQLDYIAQQAMLNQSNLNMQTFGILPMSVSNNQNYTYQPDVNTTHENQFSDIGLIKNEQEENNLNNLNNKPSSNSQKTEKPETLEKSWYLKVDNKKLGEFIEKSYHVEGYIAKVNTKLRDLISQIQTTFAPLQQMNNILSQITLQEHKKVEELLSNARNPDSKQSNMDSLEFDTFSQLQIQLNQGQNVNNSIIAQQEYILECLTNINDLINSLLYYHTTDIQHGLIHLSLLSFDQITPKLHQTCQQVAREQKKQVKLELSGESIRVSKMILEGVSFAFEHLIRNSIKHGIEDPETRVKNNKKEFGKININIQQQGEYMHINFRDDGQGIDTKAVRRRAIENNWLSEDDEVCLEQLISFILQPGFSTAQDLSQTAGRGIGLDAVVAYIREIGGEVSVVTHVNLGFSISMIFPLKSFVSDILVCKVGDYSFGTLLNNINKVGLDKIIGGSISENIAGVKEREKENFNATYLSMFDLFGKKNEHAKEHKQYIVLNTHNESYHLGLDETVLHKSMYIRKAAIPYENESLVGISIINFTEILPIYNLEMLVKAYNNHYTYETDIDTLQFNNVKSVDNTKSAFDVAEEYSTENIDENISYSNVNEIVDNTSYEDNHSHIMVVDDSSTLRFTTQRILKKYNYEVTLAIDGVEAVEKIEDMQNNNKHIDLFLVDIEMPRMDGFELISVIRSNPIHATTPIIVISSRQIEKYQQQVYDLGANDFLGKPYQTAQLMSHITRELTKANINRKYTNI